MNRAHYQQMFMAGLRKALNFFGFRRVKNIVFVAPVDFHLQHLVPVITELGMNRLFNVFVVIGEGVGQSIDLKNISTIDRETFDKMYWVINDVVVTTEFDCIPYWFKSGNRIALFHGAGPKKGYLERLTGNEFDFIFSPGPFIHNLEESFLKKIKKSKTQVIPVGLPSVDQLVNIAASNLKLKIKNEPVVLYVPSWHWNSELISMDKEILKALSLIDGASVIVRPHPNLLKPGMCRGVDWGLIADEYQDSGFVVSRCGPINDLLIMADVIIGDISSVMYEFLVLDKPGILYVKKEILEESIYSEAIKPLIEAYERIDHASELKDALLAALSETDVRKESRRVLKESTFYNIGCASSVAAKEISKIAKK